MSDCIEAVAKIFTVRRSGGSRERVDSWESLGVVSASGG